uniref:Uncharacterized protein n=1 Tax=Candidatus Methanogaster sp. ANME-2c ERB4 TaxID=2759911 RepID=A0A7G9YK95_9EURY|nr:hypothetical protein HCMIGFPE_00002 [Methanosarcinales archaeon ANME-2c ERB4]QNO48474.1 hypothetical protein PDFDOJNE_00004 [Methanosarcinales archaeon ANME-2c ERB4]
MYENPCNIELIFIVNIIFQVVEIKPEELK